LLGDETIFIRKMKAHRRKTAMSVLQNKIDFAEVIDGV